MESDLLVISLAVLAFGLVAGRLEDTPLTMPMLFTGAGLLLGSQALDVLELDVDSELVSTLAEATLVVVLFTDASRMELRSVVRHHSTALRLLVVGLPLAMVVGTGAAALLLPALPLATAALLAVTLAPTDAALGQAFVSNRAVPQRIRQTLNVESGLNDGLAVPFLTVLLDVAASDTDSAGRYAVLLAQLVGIGVLAGALVGWLAGRLLEASAARGYGSETAQRLAVVAVAVLAYATSEVLGGNGFVAAFVAGLVIGTSARRLLAGTSIFAEADGQLLALLTFLLFGAVVAPDLVARTSPAVLAYAVASLLLVRPIAVGLSLAGAGLAPATVGFIAWAGPRGLASIVYAVIVAESDVPGAETVFTVAGWTILLSILLHGVSAAPLSRRYGRHMGQAERSRPEHDDVVELPVRLPPRRGTGEQALSGDEP